MEEVLWLPNHRITTLQVCMAYHEFDTILNVFSSIYDDPQAIDDMADFQDSQGPSSLNAYLKQNLKLLTFWQREWVCNHHLSVPKIAWMNLSHYVVWYLTIEHINCPHCTGPTTPQDSPFLTTGSTVSPSTSSSYHDLHALAYDLLKDSDIVTLSGGFSRPLLFHTLKSFMI